MTKDELIKKTNEVLAEEFEIEESEITADANIKKTLQLDSLSLVDMVALIENTFSIKTTGPEVSQLQNFGALYDYIEEKMK